MSTTTLARKMMRIDEKQSKTNLDSAIFGSIGTLARSISSRPPYRIGMWPCISEVQPGLAMGVWTTLSFLLEQWQDIQVYRLFVQLEGEPDDFAWSLTLNQFTPDDWTLDELDENVALWGELSNTDDSLQLKVFIENDLRDDDEVDELVTSVASLTELLSELPQLAQQIATTIGAERLDETQPLYMTSDNDDKTSFAALGQELAAWQSYLLAYLWGYDWDDDDIEDAFDTLVEKAVAFSTDLAPWLLGQLIRQAMRPGLVIIGDLLVEYSSKVDAAFPQSTYPTLLMSDGLFGLGYAQQSYDRLQKATEKHPENAQVWLKRAELYVRGGRLVEAIDVIQSAIEQEATSMTLYYTYGNVLQLAERYGEAVTSFILIDLGQVEPEDYILYETIAAYDRVLADDPKHIRALHAQMLQRVYLAYNDDEADRLWVQFRQLLELDTTGEHVRDVIDNLYDVPDVSTAREALEARMQQQGERLDIYINLASLHLVQDEGAEALPYLEKAKTLAVNDQELAEIERLLLVANDPNFDQRFSEIVAVLDAGNSANASDVDFLEATVESAPHVLDAHLALGRAYYAWGDSDAALEVLLDAQKTLPQSPLVLDWLGRILWEADENEVAFQYLNSGLALFPNYVPLLVRVGHYLFQNRQLEQARLFLSRAEQIAPRNAALQRVRAYIADEVSKHPERYTDTDT